MESGFDVEPYKNFSDMVPTDAVEYDIIEDGKVLETHGPPVNQRSKEEIAQAILAEKLHHLQEQRRFIMKLKRDALREDSRVTRTAKSRKKRQLEKASRKRNR